MLNFKEAKLRVDEVINPTHLFYSDYFSGVCNNNVYIKPENLQKTGSFKLRGAIISFQNLMINQKKLELLLQVQETMLKE